MNTSRAKILDSSLAVTVATPSPVPVASVLPARRDDAKTFLREFTCELLREISPTAKALWLLGVATLVSGAIYFGHAAFMRYRTEQQQNTSQVETLKGRIDEQERGLAQLSERQDQGSPQNSYGTKKEAESRQNNQPVPYGPSLPTKLWNSYRKGTCLIAGSYVLLDSASGRPLRYPEVEMSQEERLLTIGTEVPLTPEGNGTIFRLEFVGTGFHVGDGYVLTNRHLVNQPWLVDLRAQFLISSSGATPRVDKLQAFFPDHRQPITLQFRTASKTDDVAVCTLKTTPPNIPALPLDEQLGAVEVGRHVVMMGYPTGPNRMLALLPEAEAIAVENEYGGSLVTLLDQLAKLKLINPLTTQGYITDLYKNRIVFDAATSEGSSGTPMLGESGKVIGITFAVLVDNRASNFAVPIAAGIEPLRRAGWRPQSRGSNNNDADGP
ncbi:MAG: serine protease [Acidobacteriota bacterium]|nr:serine protease [Acidobacteriota bacterium]